MMRHAVNTDLANERDLGSHERPHERPHAILSPLRRDASSCHRFFDMTSFFGDKRDVSRLTRRSEKRVAECWQKSRGGSDGISFLMLPSTVPLSALV